MRPRAEVSTHTSPQESEPRTQDPACEPGWDSLQRAAGRCPPALSALGTETLSLLCLRLQSTEGSLQAPHPEGREARMSALTHPQPTSQPDQRLPLLGEGGPIVPGS